MYVHLKGCNGTNTVDAFTYADDLIGPEARKTFPLSVLGCSSVWNETFSNSGKHILLR